MYKASSSFVFILVSTVLAKEPELPLCPSHIQYFPQNLPMHCRMPTNSDLNYPTLPPFPPNFPPAKLPEPIPLAGLQGAPSGSMLPIPMPPIPPIPPMHPMPVPGQKLPVVVMPLYSQDTKYKQRRVRKHRRPHPIPEDSDTDKSTDDSSDTSDENGWWRRSNKVKSTRRHRHPKRNSHKRQQLITPVLQYVTKDGYVIYEKQISKGEATDWLHMQRDGPNEPKSPMEEPNRESVEVRDEDNINVIKTDKLKQENNARRLHKKLLKNKSKNR